MIFIPEQQQTLSIDQVERSDFEHFYACPDNQQTLDILQSSQKGQQIILVGPALSGCSHLLKACCLYQPSLTAMYIPLKVWSKRDTACLQQLHHMDLICVDDVDVLIDLPLWQEAMFELINTCTRHNISMVVSAHTLVAQLDLWPDLKTRLQAMLYTPLRSISSQHLRSALLGLIQSRNLNVHPQLVDYLLNNISRDYGMLKPLLIAFDQYCMRQKCSMTPFEFKRFYPTYLHHD